MGRGGPGLGGLFKGLSLAGSRVENVCLVGSDATSICFCDVRNLRTPY